MDRIQELLTRLADLSDAEIAELEGLILAEFDSVEAEEPTNDSVERMVSLADALDGVRSEVTRRNDHAEELAQKAAEASSRVHSDAASDAPAESEMGMKEDEEEEEPTEALPTESEITEDIEQVTEDVVEAVEDAEIAGEENVEEDEEDKKKFSEDTPAEAELSDTSDNNTEVAEATSTDTELSDDSAAQTEHDPISSEQETPMTASIESDGVVVTPPADAAPVPSLTASGVALTITAGADIPSYGTGAALSSMDQVADAFAKRLHTLRNVQGGSGTQYTIATLSFDYPEDRKISGEDPDNFSKIAKVNSVEAITAAAGICAPLEPIYDINVCGDNDRPIRDALARFNADRGGVRIWGSPTLDPKAVGIWDPQGAASATNAPTGVTDTRPGGYKSCGDADCPAPQEITLDAIYACLKFSNYTNRFFPEVIKANTDLAMIHHARVAELNLMTQIATLSAANKFAPLDKKVGVTRQMIFSIRNAAALVRRKHRLAVNSPMRAILPSWVLDAMVADLALQMPGDGLETLSISESRITGLLRDAGINVTWSLDDWDNAGKPLTATSTPKAAANATGGFDAEVSFPLFPEGSFLFLDGGTLDLGVQRDMTMVSANEYATFVETFEGVAFTGCESLWVTTPVCVSGEAAALVDVPC